MHIVFAWAQWNSYSISGEISNHAHKYHTKRIIERIGPGVARDGATQRKLLLLRSELTNALKAHINFEFR